MNSGVGGSKNAVEKQSEVTRELGHLEKACVQLHEAIENVEMRFAPILTRIPRSAACVDKERAGYSCELAEYIATHRTRVEDALCRLDELRKRCEL